MTGPNSTGINRNGQLESLATVNTALTGPTKSGMKITSRPTFIRMKKNPRRVTMFGANHSGKSSTNAFHCP